MTPNHVDKILYFAVPMIVLLGIYSSQASNEMSGYFQAYNIKSSNDVLILSIDNSTYKQGQTISILGKVNHYNQGAKVHIQVIDPLKNTVSDFNELVNRFGIFGGFFSISETLQDGKYLIIAYYDGDPSRKQLSLTVNISNKSADTSQDSSKTKCGPQIISCTRCYLDINLERPQRPSKIISRSCKRQSNEAKELGYQQRMGPNHASFCANSSRQVSIIP